MKKISIAILLLVGFSVKAFAEDTTFVAVEDTTVWEDNDTSYVTEASFPSADENDYRQIWMNVHMSCPDGHEVGDQVITNCGEWDYSVQIQVLQEIGENEYDTVEIGRGATPYAGGWPPNWEHQWKIDVTDYAPLFDGDTKIRSFFHGSTEGFLAFFDFEMVEGTPPRKPLTVEEIYSNPNHEDASNTKGWPYGYTHTDVNNEHLVPTELEMPDEAEEAKARVSIKGHGFGETAGNCAEFCPKDFYLFKDGEQFADQLIWRNNCDVAAAYPQTGNWISPRTNWCPGEFSYTYDHDIPDVGPGDVFEFEMDIEDHINSPPADDDYTTPRWLTDVQWFTYGPRNFDHNAGVKRILSPSKHPDHERYNPRCDRPVIEIRNRGDETLENLTIEYGTETGWKNSFDWEGELEFMESDTVELPGSGWGVAPLFSGGGVFEVELKEPNGQEDEEPESATKTSHYHTTDQLHSDAIIVDLTTKEDRSPYVGTDIPQESRWFIFDEINHDTVAMKDFGDMDYDTRYTDTVELEDGCYRFQIQDLRLNEQGDGLSYFGFGQDSSYWFHASGGNLTLRNAGGRPFQRFTDYDFLTRQRQGTDPFSLNFGHENSKSFTVGNAMGVEEDQERPFPNSESINLFPNPAKDQMTVELPLIYENEIKAGVYDLSGKLVLEKAFDDALDQKLRFDVSELDKGNYILRLNTENEHHSEQFIIE